MVVRRANGDFVGGGLAVLNALMRLDPGPELLGEQFDLETIVIHQQDLHGIAVESVEAGDGAAFIVGAVSG